MKKLSIDDIKSNGLIGEPVAVTVLFQLNGEDVELDTFIRPFNYGSAVAKFKAFAKETETLAGTIAACVTDENGDTIFTEDDVRNKFSQNLVETLWAKIYEVNHPAIETIEDEDEAGKSASKSAKTTKSGSNSSNTVSADEASKKPKAE